MSINAIKARSDEAEDCLRRAMDASADHWEELVFHEDPANALPRQRPSWSARDIAEHTLAVDRFNLDAAIDAIRDRTEVVLTDRMRARTDWDWGNRSFDWMGFATKEQALEELSALTRMRGELFADLDADQLKLPVVFGRVPLAYMEGRGVPIEGNVEGVLKFCAEHMLDHAEQISARFP